jgi:ParB family chromosome partitioning protein
LRLLNLPDPVKEDLRRDDLTMGHARALLAIEHLPTQLNLSRKVVKRRLSVRELERIVQNFKKKQQSSREPERKDPELADLEKGLSRLLATKVLIRKNSNNSGRIEISFHSNEELSRILEHLGFSEDFS